ncbi:hypothetical protein DFO55_12852 [Grimontella sp. AG753]|nr:hypothetical protein DFO55_12852 [Grimontella sp. AG753]
MLESNRYLAFLDEIRALPSDDDSLKDFCRRKIIHGTPFIFKEREDEYYYFLKQIAVKFSIPFNNIHISGSGKLGFSFIKKRILVLILILMLQLYHTPFLIK